MEPSRHGVNALAPKVRDMNKPSSRLKSVSSTLQLVSWLLTGNTSYPLLYLVVSPPSNR